MLEMEVVIIFNRVEYNVGNGGNAGNQHFLLFPQFFKPYLLFTTQSGLLKKKKPFENIVGKGENAGNQHFLLIPSFLPILKRIPVFYLHLFCRLQMLGIWISLRICRLLKSERRIPSLQQYLYSNAVSLDKFIFCTIYISHLYHRVNPFQIAVFRLF